MLSTLHRVEDGDVRKLREKMKSKDAERARLKILIEEKEESDPSKIVLTVDASQDTKRTVRKDSRVLRNPCAIKTILNT